MIVVELPAFDEQEWDLGTGGGNAHCKVEAFFNEVDQMIAHLDDMERDEEDPKRLSRLFRLDHLATRMRRNDENLLVLAGADSSPGRREDVVLADVLRAAQAEIENYDRVEFASVEIDALVAARAVNDVVRLLAELLDNSTRFSPPNAVVLVSARQLADYVLIQIEDHGVGINPEQVAFFNTRLAAPPTMDITAFRMMGLAVKGRRNIAPMPALVMPARADQGTTTDDRCFCDDDRGGAAAAASAEAITAPPRQTGPS